MRNSARVPACIFRGINLSTGTLKREETFYRRFQTWRHPRINFTWAFSFFLFSKILNMKMLFSSPIFRDLDSVWIKQFFKQTLDVILTRKFPFNFAVWSSSRMLMAGLAS